MKSDKSVSESPQREILLQSKVSCASLFHTNKEPVSEDEFTATLESEGMGWEVHGTKKMIISKSQGEHGKAKFTFDDGSVYQGEYLEGNFHAHGVRTWANGG